MAVVWSKLQFVYFVYGTEWCLMRAPGRLLGKVDCISRHPLKFEEAVVKSEQLSNSWITIKTLSEASVAIHLRNFAGKLPKGSKIDKYWKLTGIEKAYDTNIVLKNSNTAHNTVSQTSEKKTSIYEIKSKEKLWRNP